MVREIPTSLQSLIPDDVEEAPVTTPAAQAPVTTPAAPSGYMTRDEVLAILAEQQAKHEAEMAVVTAKLPVAMVAANAGGPGTDNHQASWSLAEQEAAARGEILDHWVIR